LPKIVINELPNILWTKAQDRTPAAEPYGWDPRLAPGRVISHPIRRHLEKLCHFIDRPKTWGQLRRREQSGLLLVGFKTVHQFGRRFLLCIFHGCPVRAAATPKTRCDPIALAGVEI